METRPIFCEDEHLGFLDTIRESGATNMFGVIPYILREYPDLTREQARDILNYWMASYEERHPV